MGKIVSSFTVLFEDPFWVGIYECIYDKRYEVCKITFGAEPKDSEIYAFMLKHWNDIEKRCAVDKREKTVFKTVNPKRKLREVRKQLSKNEGIGTKAQQALKKQYEESKIAKKSISRKKCAAEKDRLYEISRQKRKEKHRGR